MSDDTQETRPLAPEYEDDSIVDLTEVDPSPIDSPPPPEPTTGSDEDYFPPKSSGTAGLGLGNHGLGYYLSRAQKYSSYAFAVFAGLHLTNTSIIPLLTRSVPASNPYLLLTRPYYQSPLTEPLLVGIPLLVHISSGVALRMYKRRQALRWYGAETHQDKRTIPWPAISGTSILGYTLVPLAGYHLLTARIMPLYMHGDSSLIGLSYIGHGFVKYPLVSFAGFTAMVGVGVWHFVWGWAKWLGLSPKQAHGSYSGRDWPRKRRWYGINLVSAIVTGLWWAGGLGIVARDGTTGGWIGKEYDELYKSLPLLGRWS